MSLYSSPLRYPGGKRKLANFVRLLFRMNSLVGGIYAEPYAGGAAVALSLLYGEYVSKIIINDINRSIYAFWYAVLNDAEWLCSKISSTSVDMQQWQKQRQVQLAENPDILDLAFSTFFMNRTNVSGIISGGVIGGRAQNGKWKIDARFNKENLIRRIEKISRYKSRIELHDLDAALFVERVVPSLPAKSLVYFDPPYFLKGRDLYEDHYDQRDHEKIAALVGKVATPWIVTYDAVKSIEDMYSEFRYMKYGLSYSAQSRYRGSEVMFFSKDIVVPKVEDPARISRSQFNSLQYASPAL